MHGLPVLDLLFIPSSLPLSTFSMRKDNSMPQSSAVGATHQPTKITARKKGLKNKEKDTVTRLELGTTSPRRSLFPSLPLLWTAGTSSDVRPFDPFRKPWNVGRKSQRTKIVPGFYFLRAGIEGEVLP